MTRLCDDCIHADICINTTQGNCEDYLSEKLIRPKGEWIMDNEHTKNPLLWYKCNLCGVYHSPTNFCPNCGAYMGGNTK